jgi:hypothetical protein
MRFIGSVIEKLQRHPKRIVFPEGTEPRVLQAARQFYSLRLGVPILLGDRSKIKEVADALDISLQGIRIINPADSEELDNFARRFEILRRSKGMQNFEAREAMLQPNYFGAMMVAMHQADGFVSGTHQLGGTVAAASIPDHQGRAANHDRIELPGDGGRRFRFGENGGHLHGGLRSHSRGLRRSNSPTSLSRQHKLRGIY